MLPVTVCIIAKNEENNMERCLRSLENMGFPVVVCDTGSSDATVETAEKYGARVVSLDWKDDFSAPRNYCAGCSGTEWVLVMDADEALNTGGSSPEALKSAIGEFLEINQKREAAGEIPVVGRIVRRNLLADTVRTEKIRRFYNKKYFCYRGIIHEQIVLDGEKNAAGRYDIQELDTGIIIDHYGYLDSKKDGGGESSLEKKAVRNLRLLEKSLPEGGVTECYDPYLLFQLGQSETILKNYGAAVMYLGRALECIDIFRVTGDSYALDLVDSFGYCLLETGERKKALEVEKYYDVCSHRADYLLMLGHVYMSNAMFEEAVLAFDTAVTVPEYAQLGANSYLPRYNKGVILEVLGLYPEAREAYISCEEYTPALERLEAMKEAGH